MDRPRSESSLSRKHVLQELLMIGVSSPNSRQLETLESRHDFEAFRPLSMCETRQVDRSSRCLSQQMGGVQAREGPVWWSSGLWDGNPTTGLFPPTSKPFEITNPAPPPSAVTLWSRKSGKITRQDSIAFCDHCGHLSPPARTQLSRRRATRVCKQVLQAPACS